MKKSLIARLYLEAKIIFRFEALIRYRMISEIYKFFR